MGIQVTKISEFYKALDELWQDIIILGELYDFFALQMPTITTEYSAGAILSKAREVLRYDGKKALKSIAVKCDSKHGEIILDNYMISEFDDTHKHIRLSMRKTVKRT